MDQRVKELRPMIEAFSEGALESERPLAAMDIIIDDCRLKQIIHDHNKVSGYEAHRVTSESDVFDVPPDVVGTFSIRFILERRHDGSVRIFDVKTKGDVPHERGVKGTWTYSGIRVNVKTWGDVDHVLQNIQRAINVLETTNTYYLHYAHSGRSVGIPADDLWKWYAEKVLGGEEKPASAAWSAKNI